MSTKVNRLGLEVQPYRGSKTTLCAGCGHNAISERIIEAFFEMGIDPAQVVKLSGIGCSSKSPAYFLGASHGFNAVPRAHAVGGHGRGAGQPEVDRHRGQRRRRHRGHRHRAVRAPHAAQPAHRLRHRGQRLLRPHQGQFSPTADLGSILKSGVVNQLPPIDTCSLAISLGASFVARSFSGDKKQLLTILKAALSHRGTCMIDVLSPCVTFNDHDGSTKSYSYVKDHEEPLSDVSFVPFFEDISVEYDEGATQSVTMHDGSRLLLHKLERDYDPTDKLRALTTLQEFGRRASSPRASSTSSRTTSTSSTC